MIQIRKSSLLITFFLLFFLNQEGNCRTNFPHTIVQFGRGRTASTNQFAILCAIARIKSSSSLSNDNHTTTTTTTTKTTSSFLLSPTVECYYSNTLPDKFPDNKIHIIKTHSCPNTQEASRRKINIFVTSTDENQNTFGCKIETKPKIIQNAKLYFREGFSYLSHQIETLYKPFFSLSEKETEILIEFMSKWEDVRRCCGFQMSRTYIKYLSRKSIRIPSSSSSTSSSFSVSSLFSPSSSSPPPLQHYCIAQNTSQMELKLKETTFIQKYGTLSPRDTGWPSTKDGQSRECIISELLFRLGMKFDASNSFQWFGKSPQSLLHMINVTLQHSSAQTDHEVFLFLLKALARIYCNEKNQRLFGDSVLLVRRFLCPDLVKGKAITKELLLSSSASFTRDDFHDHWIGGATKNVWSSPRASSSSSMSRRSRFYRNRIRAFQEQQQQQQQKTSSEIRIWNPWSKLFGSLFGGRNDQ